MAYIWIWTSTARIRNLLGVPSSVFSDAELEQFGETAEASIKADGILLGESTMVAGSDTYDMLKWSATWMALNLIGSRMLNDQQRFGSISIGGISVSAPNFQLSLGEWERKASGFFSRWATLKGHKTYPKSITEEWSPTYVKV